MLKNRSGPFPNGAYTFVQPQTGWHSTPGLDFWATVDEIIAHRLANPRFANQWHTDRESVANELDYYTCLRVKFDPQWCNPIGKDPVNPELKKNSLRGWNFPVRLASAVAAAAVRAEERASNAAAGIGVVLDWLGDSLEPVGQELAEKRARVCASCPENGRPDFIQRIEGWAASGVKELLELKGDLDLSTMQDDKLHHCQPCDCALKLKVHCRMDHILKHTSERVMESLPSHCWIKNKDQ